MSKLQWPARRPMRDIHASLGCQIGVGTRLGACHRLFVRSAQKADDRLPVGCQLLSDNRGMREYHAWAGEPATGVWTFSALLNPERMRSLSPRVRASRYPG